MFKTLKLATASLVIALVVLSSRLSLTYGLDCSVPMRLKAPHFAATSYAQTIDHPRLAWRASVLKRAFCSLLSDA